MAKSDGGISSVRTAGVFLSKGACSHTLIHVLDQAFEHPLNDEERASDPLAGGIVQHGYQCGMLWGSALAAGAEAFRRFGPGPEAETMAILAAQRIVESFRAQNGETDCVEITGINTSSTAMQVFTYFFLKGGTVGCIRRAARFAPVAYRAIQDAFAADAPEPPPAPIGCATVLARKMGASDAHAIMAAGFAGGIGLGGGACGALGAAIWIGGMNALREGRKVGFKSQVALDAIDRFLRAADFEFECAKIAGRRFENVADHAGYLRGGGCAKVLAGLAAS